jgi:hypothetical protein
MVGSFAVTPVKGIRGMAFIKKDSGFQSDIQIGVSLAAKSCEEDNWRSLQTERGIARNRARFALLPRKIMP